MLDSFTQISAIDFDFEDCDNVLRIEASKDVGSEIEFFLNSKGFYCKELL